MGELRYTVLKPFRADVGGEEILLEPGEMIPGPRVPEIDSWGRSIHHLLNTHMIGAVEPVAVGDADPHALIAAVERAGFDLAGHVLAKLDEEALLAHMEATVEPGKVLERMPSELLEAELASRSEQSEPDEAADAAENQAGGGDNEPADVESATDAGGADGEAEDGEGGAGADVEQPQPPAEAPSEPKKPAPRKPAAKKKNTGKAGAAKKPATKKG